MKQVAESVLPRTLTALGNLKTAMQEALPAGGNAIGSVTANAGTSLNTSALALESGGNLATLAGIVSSGKAATKAASGDFADGSQVAIGTTTQTKATDGSTTSWSVIQLLKGILNQLLGSVAVTGTFWQATQPISGTMGTNADTTIGGTTAPSKELTIGGKTNDGTPQYQPLPEGAGGRSVIVEGYSSGTAVPISGTVTADREGRGLSSPGNTANTTAWLVNALLEVVSGTALTADQGNSILRASLYGKHSAAADTPLAVDASGNVGVNIENTPTVTADQGGTWTAHSHSRHSRAGQRPIT